MRPTSSEQRLIQQWKADGRTVCTYAVTPLKRNGRDKLVYTSCTGTPSPELLMLVDGVLRKTVLVGQ